MISSLITGFLRSIFCSLVPFAMPPFNQLIRDTKLFFPQNVRLANPSDYPLKASDGGVKITFLVASKPRILIITSPLIGPKAQRVK